MNEKKKESEKGKTSTSPRVTTISSVEKKGRHQVCKKVTFIPVCSFLSLRLCMCVCLLLLVLFSHISHPLPIPLPSPLPLPLPPPTLKYNFADIKIYIFMQHNNVECYSCNGPTIRFSFNFWLSFVLIIIIGVPHVFIELNMCLVYVFMESRLYASVF